MNPFFSYAAGVAKRLPMMPWALDCLRGLGGEGASVMSIGVPDVPASDETELCSNSGLQSSVRGFCLLVVTFCSSVHHLSIQTCSAAQEQEAAAATSCFFRVLVLVLSHCSESETEHES